MEALNNRRRRAALALLVLPAMPALSMPGALQAHAAASTDEQLALHLLNRLGYGPGPGELALVRAMGARAWVDGQLAPPDIPPQLAARWRALAEPGTPAAEETLLRAIASPRQLEEVLAAFWLGWFRVAPAKGWDVRPHVFGRYPELRTAVVQQARTQANATPGGNPRDALRALARQFVAIPSDALLRSLTQVWDATGGDQRAVLRALFASQEFLAPAQHNSMRKDDFRYVVSALRASGIAVENAAPLAAVLRRPMTPGERDDFAARLAQGRLALALAPPRAHRYASSAPPLRAATAGDPPQGGVAQPGPVLMEAPTPSAAAMAAAARSQPSDAGRLLALLRSEAFQRY